MNQITPFKADTNGFQYNVERKGGITVINTEAKAAGSHVSALIETSSDGKFLKIGTVTQIPGESQVKSFQGVIAMKDIGSAGIEINGSRITLGNINFLQMDKDNNPVLDTETGAEKIDLKKSIKLIGTDGDDQFVIDGDTGKTKVEADLKDGDDTLIGERSAAGTVIADFGKGEDSLWTISGSKLKISRPKGATDAAAENSESSDQFEYIK